MPGNDLRYDKWGPYFDFHFKSEMEVFYLYSKALKKNFKDVSKLKMLEIGAGFGKNLIWFNFLGIPFENIYANELSAGRVDELRKNLPEQCAIIPGDFAAADINIKFQVILQSTVFTSILDRSVREQIADKAFGLLSDDGIFIWYDFRFNNPSNKNVRGVSRKEVKQLFPRASKIEFSSCTMFPAAGRRLGRFYNLLNALMPFLRTHTVAVIHK
jgi:hypothetical protein